MAGAFSGNRSNRALRSRQHHSREWPFPDELAGGKARLKHRLCTKLVERIDAGDWNDIQFGSGTSLAGRTRMPMAKTTVIRGFLWTSLSRRLRHSPRHWACIST